MKRLLFILSALLWCMTSFAQYNIEVGSVEYLPLEPPAGYVRSANWSCDEGLVLTDRSEAGAIVMVDHYFSGAAYVNCSYVYEYLGSYDNNYHAGRGTKTYRITCIGETVTISETQLNLNPGEKHRLTFVRKNSHGTPVWTSSNTNVATVNESGTVTAVKSGHAVITLDPIVGEPRFCDVTVIQIDPESMSLEPESITVKAGDKSRFTCIFKPSGASSDVTWTSSNESVATVNSSGVITGVSEGSAQITAASENGLTAVGTVEVVPLPEQVMLPSGQEIRLGYQFRLNPELIPANAISEYEWESENPDVATIDASGKIKGISKGSAIINVTTENGKTASCTVTVTDAPEGMDYRNAGARMDALKSLIKESLKNL